MLMAMDMKARLAKALAYCQEEKWNKAANVVQAIGKLGMQKQHRSEATLALRTIAELPKGGHLAWPHLADLAIPEDVELLEFLQARLTDDRAGYACAEALLRCRGQDCYALIIDRICDERLSSMLRYELLDVLGEHLDYPFEDMIPDSAYADYDPNYLPMKQLQQWRDNGYGKLVEPKIEIPVKQLQKAGITLPDDYEKFLLKHRGRDLLEFEDDGWNLFTAAQLFESVEIDDRAYPQIRELKGYVSSMEDAFEDGQTVDAKGKPYALERLASGLAIGKSDGGDVLYLDPADGNAVWIFHHDGGDVQKAGKSFGAWRRKARMA